MPIEIRELVIRATIDPKGEKKKEKKSGDGKAGAAPAEIVARCVEEVLDILSRREER